VLIAPLSALLIGMFKAGNLLREAGVVERLSNMAQNELINAGQIGSVMAGGAIMALLAH